MSKVNVKVTKNMKCTDHDCAVTFASDVVETSGWLHFVTDFNTVV